MTLARICLLLFFAPLVHADSLRLLTHSAFALDKELLTQFEAEHNITVEAIPAGDAGAMVTRLLLTKNRPIADIVYGIDHIFASKAFAHELLAPLPNDLVDKAIFDGPLSPINVGYISLNYDPKKLSHPPENLPELLAQGDKLSVQNPASSSPGVAFMLFTIQALGESEAFAWWSKLRSKGVRIAPGWSESYYQHFSYHGGNASIVVSYNTSPAAEQYYGKLASSPTANVPLAEGMFVQYEGAGVIKGGKNPDKALALIRFLRSQKVQASLPTTMWVFPLYADPPPFFPPAPTTPILHVSAGKLEVWIRRWVDTMLR